MNKAKQGQRQMLQRPASRVKDHTLAQESEGKKKKKKLELEKKK